MRRLYLRLTIFGALSAMFLTGCVGGVTLRHPQTGVTATCPTRALMFGLGYMEHERCLDDYRGQGYVRVPE